MHLRKVLRCALSRPDALQCLCKRYSNYTRQYSTAPSKESAKKTIFAPGGQIPVKIIQQSTPDGTTLTIPGAIITDQTISTTQSPIIITTTSEKSLKEDELEIKDPALIFENVVKKLEEKFGRERLHFPREIYFLLGAPGAGKGTMNKYIMHERGITAKPIGTSELLETPEMRKLKDQGYLISDRQVIELVFTKLLSPEYENGVIVDGFPRTVVQAHCVSFLYDFMLQLRKDMKDTPYASKFLRPVFRITVLFVDEQVSIKRQIDRGRKIKEHNRIVRETGIGKTQEERATDSAEDNSKKRYKFFRDSIYESIKLLQQKFDYNFIDASGDVAQVAKNIITEFAYQSSVELGKETFDLIGSVPPAEDLILHARQNLVKRLDGYQMRHHELFKEVLKIIQEEFLHIMRRQALSGMAIIRTENEIFNDPLALNMVLDVLTERGYQVILDSEKKLIPERIDPTTNEIICKSKRLFHFEVQFSRPKIRN
jgi:adenylate kinase